MRKIQGFAAACLMLAATAAQGAIVYDASVQTGFRTNVGVANFFAASTPADNTRIAYDDVPINNTVLGAATSMDVTKVTVGIRQVAGAPTTDVSVFWTTLTTTVTAPDTQIDSPGSLIGTTNLPAAAASVTSLVTFGDGVNTLFNVPLNSTLIPGFGSFALGVRLSSTDSSNGWRNTTPAAGFANANQAMWVYDPNGVEGIAGTPTEFGPFGFGVPSASVPPTTFYIVIEGNPVPEPTSLSMLVLGAAALARRRR